MSTFSKTLTVLFVFTLLAGCQSTSSPPPESITDSIADSTVEDKQAVAEPEAVIDYDRQFYDEALLALKSGNLDNAIDLLEQLGQQAPLLPYLYTNLGLAYLGKNNYDQADKAFRQAILQDSRDAIAYNHLGIIQRYQGDFHNAQLTYQKAIEINESYAGAHLNLGILYDIYLQKLDLALQQYRQYQALIEDEQDPVANWIIDIERRIRSEAAETQG